MLISFVQSIIGPFDKYFSPFDESSGEERRDCAENHLLEKSRVHRLLKSSAGASHTGFTKIPIVSFS